MGNNEQQAPDTRLTEIREQQERDSKRFDAGGHHFGRADIRKMLCAIDYLLSLQQPASERCDECGHRSEIDEHGFCAANIADFGHCRCGCKCVFPATGTSTCKWVQDKSDYRWYKTGCGRETDSFVGGFCTYCGKVIEVDGKVLETVATTGAGEGRESAHRTTS